MFPILRESYMNRSRFADAGGVSIDDAGKQFHLQAGQHHQQHQQHHEPHPQQHKQHLQHRLQQRLSLPAAFITPEINKLMKWLSERFTLLTLTMVLVNFQVPLEHAEQTHVS